MKVWLGAVGSAVAIHAAVAIAFGGGRHADVANAGELTGPEISVDYEEQAPPAPPAPPVAHTPDPTNVVAPPKAVAHEGATLPSASSALPSSDSSAGDTSPVPSAAPPVFTITLAPTSSIASIGASPKPGTAEVANASQAEAIETPASVSVPARVVASALPAYPEMARDDGLEADVGLEIVVDAKGGVTDAHVTKSGGESMDKAALAAMRAYRFSPAERNGRAVRVRMPWVVQFRLR